MESLDGLSLEVSLLLMIDNASDVAFMVETY